jgi:hypothetical protein
MDNNQLIIFSKVVDVTDKKLSGKIRAIPEGEIVRSILDSVKDANPKLNDVLNDEGTDIRQKYWYKKGIDPFVFKNLLPFWLNVQPSNGEMVLTIRANTNSNPGRLNQFYIPGLRADPRNVEYENESETKSVTAQGINYKESPDLLNVNGEYNNKNSFGIFAGPEDNAIYGKGSTDLILKRNEVLLRAGKCGQLTTAKDPTPNINSGGLQISYFDGGQYKQKPQETQKLVVPNEPIGKVIEYDITSGLDNALDSYSGSVKIFNLPQLDELKSLLFKFDTELPQVVTNNPVFIYNFENLPLSSTTDVINSVIKGLNDSFIEIPDNDRTTYSPADPIFPFFYRPSKNLRKISQSTPDPNTQLVELTKKINVISLMSDVKLSDSISIPGYGIVMEKDKFGLTPKIQKQTVQPTEYNNNPVSVSILKSNEIYLLAYDTNVKNLPPISYPNRTVYGLDQNDLTNEVQPKTEPLVRGESLKELLNLIVQVLTTHVHPYDGLPPVPDGNYEKLLTEFQLYDTKILNQKIRIS